jgi:hypothetical protein
LSGGAGNNPDDDYDIVRVNIDGRLFRRLTTDRPTRTRFNVGGTDFGGVTTSEDYEPSAGAVPTVTLTPAQAAKTGGGEGFVSTIKMLHALSSVAGKTPTVSSRR